jgi:protein-S-isoprenylcysteine O-methyltransferase Ste14
MRNKLLPPTYLNTFLVLAIGLHFILPIKRIIHPPYTYSGLIIILFGVALNVWSARLLKKKSAAIDFYETPTRLVIDGPFRISRNPLYLGGVILSLGIAVLLGSLITFVFPTALLLILDKLYIPVEEKRLEKTFGKKYLEYKQRVRRWI